MKKYAARLETVKISKSTKDTAALVPNMYPNIQRAYVAASHTTYTAYQVYRITYSVVLCIPSPHEELPSLYTMG